MTKGSLIILLSTLSLLGLYPLSAQATEVEPTAQVSDSQISANSSLVHIAEPINQLDQYVNPQTPVAQIESPTLQSSSSSPLGDSLANGLESPTVKPTNENLGATVAAANAKITQDREQRQAAAAAQQQERANRRELPKVAQSPSPPPPVQPPQKPQPPQQPGRYYDPPEIIASESAEISIAIDTPTVIDTSIVVEMPVVRKSDTTSTGSKPFSKKLTLENITFECGADGSIPATVAKMKDLDELLVIRWASDFFKAGGYDAQTRCKQVSARFEDYKKAGDTLYLTSGKLNGQSVICVTNQEDGNCGKGILSGKGLLFTLKPTDSSQETLKDLVAVLQSNSESDSQPIDQ